MDYGEIIGRSWRITWNNKFLWVLGFLAALTSSGGYTTSGQEFPTDMEVPELAQLGAIILAVVCIALVIAVALWLVSLAARNGLIFAADRLDEGLPVTFGDAFGAGWRVLGRTIGVALLLFLPVILIALVVVAAAVAITGASFAGFDLAPLDPESPQFGLLMACLALLCCCLAILFALIIIILYFVYAFAIRGVVLQGLGVVEAARHGWQVLRANLPEITILSLIFFFLNLIFNLALLVVLLPLYLLLVLAILGGELDLASLGLANALPVLALSICYGLLYAAFSSILVAWQSTTFTLAYREFISKPLV